MLKKVIYKRSVLLFWLSGIFLLSGCGQSGNPLASTPDSYVNEEMEASVTRIEDKAENDEIGETSEALPKPLEIPVNTQMLEVSYLNEDGIKPMRALHRCVSDGENIFLAYGEKDIYVMPIGADKHSPMNLENPDGMLVCNVAMDIYGGLHLLMAAENYEEWYIWRLDEDYQIDKVVDISAYFETKQIPLWFLVNKDGTYYFQWILDRSGLIVDGEGVMMHKTTPETLGISWILEAAVGKDGEIYLLYENEEDKIESGVLKVENGSIEREDATLSFPGNETFSQMSVGTDTNLLLFSPISGVWAYDSEKGILENRVTISDIDFGKDMEFWPLTFLPDGRLLLAGHRIPDGSTENDDVLMKYIPAGR